MSDETDILNKPRKVWYESLFSMIKVLGMIPSVVIDGFIVFLIGTQTTMSMCLTGDDAYKYVNPYTLFWIKFYLGSFTAGLVALQSFRSRVFADHVSNKKLKEQPQNG